jgi:hypothetical protein
LAENGGMSDAFVVRPSWVFGGGLQQLFLRFGPICAQSLLSRAMIATSVR